MVPAQRTRLKILTAIVAGSVAMGCGSDGDKPEGTGREPTMPGEEGEGNLALELTFSPMYSAFGGSHEFRLPVQVKGGSGDLKVTTDPPGFVDYTAAGNGVVMLTMKKSGKCVVRIKDGAGNTGKADLTVTPATDEEWELGKSRYNNGITAINVPEGGFPTFDASSIMLPDGSFDLDAAIANYDGGAVGERFDASGLRNDMAACASCHVSAGAGGMMMTTLPDGRTINAIDVEHTPQQTGGYSDDQLITIFTKGEKPAEAPFRVLSQIPFVGMNRNIVQMIYQGLHRWDVGPDVQKAIIVYLRSLEPKSQPNVDFGGLLPPRGSRDGGVGIPRMDAGTTAPASDAGTTSDASTTSDAGTTSDATASSDAGTDAN